MISVCMCCVIALSFFVCDTVVNMYIRTYVARGVHILQLLCSLITVSFLFAYHSFSTYPPPSPHVQTVQ